MTPDRRLRFGEEAKGTAQGGSFQAWSLALRPDMRFIFSCCLFLQSDPHADAGSVEV